MADHAKPATTSTYALFVTELDGRLDDLALGLDPANTTATGLITNSIRWNSQSGTNKWQRYDGSNWSDLAGAYNININGTVGATTASTGAFTTLSTSGVASLGAASTVDAVPIVSTSGTQTLTNKTLTAPVISTITNNSITLTLPTTVDTLVGRATTDTLTNKTLTAPKFASTGFIADTNGNELLQFAVTAAAVNHVQVTNSATTTNPVISAVGTDANISLNLVPKGTGAVQADGLPVVTTSGTQTLTNKTLTAPVISTITNNSITLTLPTTVDTLVGRATTDTLTNKTLTAPKFASAGFIADTNGNELLEFTLAASAVNHLVLANSAAAADLTLTTTGTDANISLDIVCKGTGTLEVDGIPVATISDTQTLTNKSLSDSTTFFIDETTATKRMQFQLSGITAATTRTITIPDVDITLFGTTSIDTLTNKTMSTGSVWNGGTIGVAYGGTGTSTAPTQGGVIYGSSTTAYATTAAGTTNQLLQSNGTSAPSWTSLDLALHAPDSSYKKIVRLATTGDLEASTFAANVLTGYSATQTLSVTTNGTNTVTTASTAGIKVGAAITANALFGAGITVSSITNATTFVVSGTTTAGTASTTFTQVISALSLDGGIAVALNDRILVKDQSSLGGLSANTSALTNGIYSVTATGSAAVPWTLTRTTDADAATDLDSAIVNVSIGTNNGGKTFHNTFLGSNNLNSTPMYWNRVVNTSASFFLPAPTTARGIDLDIEPKTVRLDTLSIQDLAINSFGVKTIQSLAASVYTNAATVYIAGAPVASTNATITNSYSLHVAAGTTLLSGNLFVTGGTISAGNVTTALLGGNTTTNINIGAGLTTGTYTVGAAGSTGAVTLFPATGSQAITLGGATTGTIQIGSTLATAVQLPSGKTKVGQTFVTQGGAVTVTLPTVAGTLVGSGDTGTVSNTMLAGSIANAKLTNSSVTIGSTAVSLGATVTTFAGLTSVTSTGFTGTLTGSCSGNAGTATTLQTARTIGGVSFDGSANINLPGVNAAGNQNTSGTAASTPLVSVDNSIAYGRSGLQFINVSGLAGDVATTTNTPNAEWWHIIRGNHSNVTGYYTDLALPMTAANNIRYRRIAAGVSSGWITVLDSTNYNSYSPTLTGTGASGTWSIAITGNAGTVAGLAVHAGTNNEVNKIVRTDANGYINAGWINTASGDAGTTTIDRVYASNDGYIRYYTPANFRTVLDVPTRTGGSASGTWAIAITGNAATATVAGLVSVGAGGYLVSTAAASTSYGNAIQIRERSLAGAQASAMTAAPRLGFHWSGLVASSIAMEASGRIGIFNDPGTSYEALVCAGFQATTGTFSGAVAANAGIGGTLRRGSYGAISVNGSNGGYSGIDFFDYSATLMVNGSLSGIYRSNSTWDWYFNNGVLTVGTVPAANVSGTVSSASACTGAAASNVLKTGDTMTGGLDINYNQPTISFRDTDGMPAFLHNNSNLFYILRHATANSTGWDSGPNGRHPMTMNLSSGDVTFSGNVTAYSDARLKKNVTTIANPLHKVKQLVGVSFERLEGQKGVGLIAQNVQEVLPEVVTEDKDGYLSVAYGNMVGLLIEAVKEQQQQLDAQQQRIEKLEQLVLQLVGDDK